MINDEDIHMGIESRLIARTGDVGKKLHTARSRNDQCQVDGRLYVRKEIKEIIHRLCYLESVILERQKNMRMRLTLVLHSFSHVQPLSWDLCSGSFQNV